MVMYWHLDKKLQAFALRHRMFGLETNQSSINAHPFLALDVSPRNSGFDWF